MNYLEKVKKNGCALEYVPTELHTAELCLAAVKQDCWALEHVPLELRTVKLCLAAVKKNSWVLKHVPLEHRTAELCFAAVKQDGCALEHVPLERRTAELCFAAVKQNGWELRYVPRGIFQPNEIYKGNYLFSTILGSRDSQTMYDIESNQVYCGCFKDTLESFEIAVKDTHKNTNYLQGYLEFINICKTNKKSK